MKPVVYNFEPIYGSSFSIKRHEGKGPANIHKWHIHHFYELIFISGGNGTRHMGNNISHYEGGDLILLAPNLPHASFRGSIGDNYEIVVQMDKNFLGKDFFKKSEMEDIRNLLERAKSGLSFGGATKKEIGKSLKAMLNMEPFDKLLEMLRILQILAKSRDFITFNVKGLAFEINSQDRGRTDIIYKFVQNNFQNSIGLDAVAREVNMTVPSFCRHFKKVTNMTFTNFVNEFRIAYACKLLKDDNLNISEISLDSGFNNLSHFNKKFKDVTGMSPSEYRKSLIKVIQE